MPVCVQVAALVTVYVVPGLCPVAAMAVVVEREQRVQVVTVLPCAVQVGAVVDTEFECPRAGIVSLDKFALHLVHFFTLVPVAVQVAAFVVVYVLLGL